MDIIFIILSIWAVASICKSKPPKIYKNYDDFDTPEECATRFGNNIADHTEWAFKAIVAGGSTIGSLIFWIIKHSIQLFILFLVYKNVIEPFFLRY